MDRGASEASDVGRASRLCDDGTVDAVGITGVRVPDDAGLALEVTDGVGSMSTEGDGTGATDGFGVVVVGAG